MNYEATGNIEQLMLITKGDYIEIKPAQGFQQLLPREVSKTPVVQAGAAKGPVLLLGDSITVGYAPRVNKICQATPLAQTGAQTAKILENYKNKQGTFGTIVVLGGVNDIASGRTAETVIENLKAIKTLAESRGAHVIFLTITPWRGYTVPGSTPERPGSSWTEEKQARTDAVNAWIRTQRYIDTAVVLGTGQYLKQEFRHDTSNGKQIGDLLHPNNAGDQALADAVESSLGCS
jgi:lysophospholipase L1-like esterase